MTPRMGVGGGVGGCGELRETETERDRDIDAWPLLFQLQSPHERSETRNAHSEFFPNSLASETRRDFKKCILLFD